MSPSEKLSEFIAIEKPTGDFESAYEQFYMSCADLSEDQIRKCIDVLLQWDTRRDPVIRSYALLFLAAIVDESQVASVETEKISARLSGLLDTLADYRVFDDLGRFIHFISHATFLATALRERHGSDFTAKILTAYLRADVQYNHNEDVIVGHYLLADLSSDGFIDTLMAVTPRPAISVPSENFRIKEANKKALWLAALALNQQLKLQPAQHFNAMLTNLSQHVID